MWNAPKPPGKKESMTYWQNSKGLLFCGPGIWRVPCTPSGLKRQLWKHKCEQSGMHFFAGILMLLANVQRTNYCTPVTIPAFWRYLSYKQHIERMDDPHTGKQGDNINSQILHFFQRLKVTPINWYGRYWKLARGLIWDNEVLTMKVDLVVDPKI